MSGDKRTASSESASSEKKNTATTHGGICLLLMQGIELTFRTAAS